MILRPLQIEVEGNKPTAWMASSGNILPEHSGLETPIVGTGKTPEEAVSNLYLKLNEK